MADTKLIAGNWKMNGLPEDSKERVRALVQIVAENKDIPFTMVLCPPALMISDSVRLVEGSEVKIGGQDCHQQISGAFTGNISAEMLKKSGCDYVIVGHSERRQYHAETDALVAEKAKAAHEAGLIAIICVGEQEADRDAGNQNIVVAGQLAKSIPETATSDNTVVAYEPVWAIGTGKVASNEDIKLMHAFIRVELNKKIKSADNVSILYGGSVKPDSALEILHTLNVGGVLVGGASLKAEDFGAIAKASANPKKDAA